MSKYNLIIGSHVSMKQPDYLLGSLKEAISYDANALMIYTGAPQNTMRRPTKEFNINEFHNEMKNNNIPLDNLVVHAPYIINLCSINPSTRELAVSFLRQEIKRCEEIGAKWLVLHPGSATGNPRDLALDLISEGLNSAMYEGQKVHILLETMAGKGTECGKTIDEIQTIIQKAKYKSNLGICLDTCHIHDANYDLKYLDNLLEEIDQKIGLHKMNVIHLNDSKNIMGAAKDRHENLGYGHIPVEYLLNVLYHPKTEGVIKILETPWYEDKPPYAHEIKIIKEKKWYDFKKTKE